jgi:chromosome segregation ATPase
MSTRLIDLQNILKEQEILVGQITHEKNSEKEFFITKIINIIKNLLKASDHFQKKKSHNNDTNEMNVKDVDDEDSMSENDILIFLSKFETTTTIVQDVVRITSTIDETDKTSLSALRIVIRGLIDSVRQFQGIHVGNENIEGLEAEIDNLGYSICTLDSTVNTLQDPIVRSIDTIMSMNDTIDELFTKINTMSVLEKSVTDIIEKVSIMHNIDAKTIESVNVMGNTVLTVEKSVNDMSIAMARLESFDWKSVESMHVMDDTLIVLRESIARLDAIDVNTLDSMKNMISTIDAMKINLQKLDSIDLSTIESINAIEKTNADLKYSIDFLKQMANKNKDDLAEFLLRFIKYDDDIKRLDEKDAVLDTKTSSTLDLIHVIEKSLAVLTKQQENIQNTVQSLSTDTDKLRQEIHRLDASDIVLTDHLQKTDNTISSMDKTMYVVGETIKSLRDQDSKNEEHVLLLERTVSDLSDLIQKLDASDKRNITTIGTLNNIIDLSNTKINTLEIIINRLEQHSTKVLVVSIEKIEKINKMLLTDVEHLNICLRDYELRPDKTKRKHSN